jgi:hypothetical protein
MNVRTDEEGVTTNQRLTEHPRVIGVFRIVKKMSDGFYIIETHGETAMWTLRKLRKVTHCSATRNTLNKGEYHYGPVGNMNYRGWRIHRQFVEERV